MTEALENLGPVVSGQEARLPWRPRDFIQHYVEAIARARRLSFTAVSPMQLRISGECYAFNILLDGPENSSFVKEVQLLFGEHRVERTMVRLALNNELEGACLLKLTCRSKRTMRRISDQVL